MQGLALKGLVLTVLVALSDTLQIPVLKEKLDHKVGRLTTSTFTPICNSRHSLSLFSLRDRFKAADEYKENFRTYRRTVFDDDDWVDFRSSDRLWTNIAGIAKSGTVRGLALEISSILAVSTFVYAINQFILSSGNDVSALLSLPVLPFQLSAPALGLLLVFRTNSVYARWNAARACFEQIEASAMNLVRQGMAYLENNEEKEELARRTIALVHTCKWRFRKGEVGKAEEEREKLCGKLTDMLGATEAERIMRCRFGASGGGATIETCGSIDDTSTTTATLHCSITRSSSSSSSSNMYLQVISDLTRIIRRSTSIDGSTKSRFDQHLDMLVSSMVKCKGIRKQPVPLQYTRHTNRFLSLWLLLLPLALVKVLDENIVMIPVCCLMGLFFFGIEELGVQLEEPFSIMPLEAIVDSIESDVLQMLAYQLDAPEDITIGGGGGGGDGAQHMR